ARYTRDVYALSPYSNPRIRAVTRAGRFPPPLKRVVYIIRENRTYDQVLGDVERGNGDRALALFNDTITPNAHALARRWVLFDNFYVDGEVSADGHEWTDRAFANDYNQKTWPQIYSDRREWDLTSGEDLANRRGSYLWDAARTQGLWVVNFGEGTLSESDAPDAATNIRTNLPGLKAITVSNYPGFVLDIPDTTRARRRAPLGAARRVALRAPRRRGQHVLHDELGVAYHRRDPSPRPAEPVRRRGDAAVERLHVAPRRRGVCPSAEHLAAGRTQPQRVPLAHSGSRSRSGGRGG